MSSNPVVCQSSTCINGNPPSKMECPTCMKLGIRGSVFCGQPCFKAGWKSHKIVHDLVTRGQEPAADGTYNPFPNFSYTGGLPKRPVPDHIPRPDYAETGKPMAELKAAGHPPKILSLENQEKMRKVCKLAREVLDLAASHIRPGITTDEIDEIVHKACIERNSYPSPLNYRNFPKSVCTSINECICHGIPDKRKLKNGDIINIDVTLYHEGYHGDVNATYPVGEIDEASKKLLRTSRESLDAAIAICKPGALFRDVGNAIEPVAKRNKCATVRNCIKGHGVNDLFHTAPNVPHYAKSKAVGAMKPGMVFTIEPMINIGNSYDAVHWPDNWTATTVDGQRSAQYEETLLITETGVEVLTAGAPQVI
ncbi:peptidase M24, structural domain-containing protein [Flagelloscypha sp. PMI_526]|nr:peptidase M24, structural domain-containing protein [Flagelloscypha sp. PMI_526]